MSDTITYKDLVEADEAKAKNEPTPKRTFTVEEIKKYISSQDSFGDAIYFCNEANIILANQLADDDEELSECCTATIIHGDICSDCLEHV